MNQKRTTTLPTIIRKARSRERILGVSIIAVFFVACHTATNTTNQPTPSPSGAQSTPGATPRQQAIRNDFPSWDKLVEHANAISCGKMEAGTHDDQIIVTNGSVHLSTKNAPLPTSSPGNDYFQVSPDQKKITSTQKAVVQFVGIHDGVSPPSGYDFLNVHAEVSLAYQSTNDFLMVTTFDPSAIGYLVLQSQVAFSQWTRKSPNQLAYDENFHQGGHTRLDLKTDIPPGPIKPDHPWSVSQPQPNSKFLFVVCVQNNPAPTR